MSHMPSQDALTLGAFTSITPTALASGSTHNYNPVDATTGEGFRNVDIIRQATNASGSTLTGLAATTNGDFIIIENLGPGALALANETGSTLINRFTLPSSTDLDVPVAGAVMLAYDGATSRWRTASGAGGAGGVTGTMTTNTVPVATGAGSLGDSSITEDATDLYIDGNSFRLNKAGNKVYLSRSLMDGATAPGATHGSLIVYTGGAGVVTAGGGDDGGIQSFVTATLNLAPAETAQTLAFYAGNSATKTTADGTLINYGILINVAGGDQDYAYYAINGDFYHTGDGAFGGELTADSLIGGGSQEFQVSNDGYITLGQKVESFRIDPSNAANAANISIGGAYASGCQLTTKNRVVAGSSTAGIDVGLDTTVNAAIGGGVFIWRGAGGGFGGANNGALVFPGAPGQGIVGSAVGDLCLINTTPSRNLLLSSDGSGFTIGAQLDGSGVFQAKALKTGATMGTGSQWTSGNGSPNGAVVGSPGDLYTNTAGGAGTTLYVKESGTATNTGWVGK